MNDILFDYLDDFCTMYLDDILIYSENLLEHYEHVQKVLQQLQDTGLQVNIKKSEFQTTCIKFLRFIVFMKGVEVDSAKIVVVQD
jgi:hypothetical protein